MTRPLRDEELGATLRDIGERLAYPTPTRLEATVRARLRGPRPGGSRWRWPRLTPALATLGLLVLVVSLGSPGARAAADEFLRVRGIEIFRVPSAPTAPPEPLIAIPGERVTLAEARARVPFPVRVPVAEPFGDPDDVYVELTGATDRVTLVYRDRRWLPRSSVAGVSALVVELRGVVDELLLGKAAGPGTRIERVSVNGARGYWIEGEPHLFFYRDAMGAVRDETLRLAGNTLLWEEGGITLRLEADVTKEEALAIAASLR